MFDILEADIVVFQETKIQRKDLTDDMVLVPGWDCYFSLPKHKKGYSGVVIYTRQAVCAPIRAEEGITGVLCPPNSSTAFADLPPDEQIGGYPSALRMSQSEVDATTLDSEGRCVILEFPALVLIGTYCPANRDETRDDFRLSFLDVLDARVRNLVAMGKRVFLTGDLNISRDELDAANAEASMRKQGLSDQEFVSTPARRLFNHLLEGGKVFGARDEGRQCPVMWDICRSFHPVRKGMFTCWEQKVNARPGNCGARIDYVLCSLAMKDWFSDSNIQEGLMGSDHCPVYAIMKDKISIDGEEHHTKDVMNPPGVFVNGERQRAYSSTTDPLPLSGRLIPEFFGRRNIRDMFARKPSISTTQSSVEADVDTQPELKQLGETESTETVSVPTLAPSPMRAADDYPRAAPSDLASSRKRSAPDASTAKKGGKRTKPVTPALTASPVAKGQQSLAGFFKPKRTDAESSPGTKVQIPQVLDGESAGPAAPTDSQVSERSHTPEHDQILPGSVESSFTSSIDKAGSIRPSTSIEGSPLALETAVRDPNARIHDPIESKESWSKLFTKPAAPRCEGHEEPCISMLTKKAGMNLGRSFWMCGRPLGPSGAKEKNTQWRCGTFIWCSDWNTNTAGAG